MKYLLAFASFTAATAIAGPVFAAAIEATMYKNPTCSCCETYAAYLERNGFEVTVVPSNDLTQISQEAGVPASLQGCHTIKIGDYVVEGFVPAVAVKRMLAERPAITGIAVPGMPMGEPGMEMTPLQDPLTSYAFIKGSSEPTVYSVD